MNNSKKKRKLQPAPSFETNSNLTFDYKSHVSSALGAFPVSAMYFKDLPPAQILRYHVNVADWAKRSFDVN